ncbi:hypothetical protein Clacol_002955 [Clathrus columnatus]|uniref:protein-tyrosine-phosphatase n=1 Tax=Clathrus columnatus TaxID=1419009 RepID=A0AAV5A845_9AGAM|nr:hypothetical protein Clacol_002955 [Clathrus columnatus]
MPAVHRFPSQVAQKPPSKIRTLPTPLRIERTEDVSAINFVSDEAPSSAFSDQSEVDSATVPPPAKLHSIRNRKKLSLTILTQSNGSSTSLSGPESPFQIPNTPLGPPTRRRSSIVSLPNVSSVALRRDEETSPTAPYPDGPIEILPGIWIGTEDNARDWKSLVEKGIRSILNVAKEVALPYVSLAESNLRSTVSTPNLSNKFGIKADPTYIPSHVPSGRPAMHYLRLPWSHGQADLVHKGFIEGMAFVDASLSRGDGVLIHCQCGVSRSATMVIALVMRAAHSNSPSIPPEVLALKSGGMHASYAFVKEKSKWVGPNMSLMYQLLEYERTLNSGNQSPAPSDRSSQIASEEAEWGRKRQEMEEASQPNNEREPDGLFMREARALDLEMEQRMEARKGSQHSTASVSSSGSCLLAGNTWKSRFGTSVRSRAGSAASNFTSRSILSENLLEEDEDNLGESTEVSVDNASLTTSTDVTDEETLFSRFPSFPPPPPSAPVFRNSFALAPPPSASHSKTSFGFLQQPMALSFTKLHASQSPASVKFHRRSPAPRLPPVPPSPVGATAAQIPIVENVITPKKRIRPSPAPLLLSSPSLSTRSFSSTSTSSQTHGQTPSHTLFVFPPEESVTTPSTLTITSSLIPLSATPRISSFQREGRRRSLILGPPPTPTTACSRVDVLGFVARGP